MIWKSKISWGDRYGILLLGMLTAHAVAGKGFAYLGIAPFYVTEVILAAGIFIMLQTSCILASLMNMPNLFLLMLIALTACQTIPFIPIYGVDALRDSVLCMYGIFSFIGATLVLQRPERIVKVVQFLRWFTGFYVFVGPAVYIFSAVVISGSAAPMRAGELGVHLSACAVLALVGLRPVRPLWLCGLGFGIVVVAAQNRGGLLAIIIPLAFALTFNTQMWSRAIVTTMGATLLLGLAYAANLEVPSARTTTMELHSGERRLGARQAVDNILSLFAANENTQLADTTRFRTMWWSKIWSYTVGGDYFWTGKGFGVNLAVDDGFVVGDRNAAPLRSPHNSHMNVLARIGVPGLVFWAAFMVCWFGTLMSSARRAWRHGETNWGNLMLFVVCYWLANVINASFDVALEGPMLGTWFWCQIGFGLGVVAVYRAGANTI